ncbi:MAG: hypothetical protein J1F38_02395 [Muribaculaceae bacterium]|nr:hypothetical protein [Muribaculaceae bacterium]
MNFTGNKNIFFATLLAAMLGACSTEEPLRPGDPSSFAGPAVVEASIGKINTVETRATHNTYDLWSIATFSIEDNVGLYTVKGMQDPENEESYDFEVKNGKMYFESVTGSRYRFSNSEIILDPVKVHDNYSIMYYPYYENMPDPDDTSAGLTGIPIRVVDEELMGDKIERCLDFMETSMYSYLSSGSYYSSTVHKLPISSGVLQPSFYHYMSQIVVQRGDGFRNAPDKRVWIVMKNAYTDIRVLHTSPTTNYTYQLQNTLDTGLEKIALPNESEPKLRVNKHRVWEAWKGNEYNGIESYYAVIPCADVAYIFMQDDKGDWRGITNFYLDYENSNNSNITSKAAKMSCRYVVTAEMDDIQPVIRPVVIENWTDGGIITDMRDAGINSLPEYRSWVALYNTYVLNERSDEYEEPLKKFGDVVKNTTTGEASWTFYINTNLNLPEGFSDKIIKLEDILLGSSVYVKYKFSNIHSPLIGEIGNGGVLKSLEFQDLYIIDLEDNGNSFSGGLIEDLDDGMVESCNIINGIIVSNKGAGMLAGKVKSATVKDCIISGQVIGSETSEDFPGLFGVSKDGEVNIYDSNLKELYFESYN